ncbi:MAG: hypothetical protein IKS36_02025 [Bacteroidales bacterium]|nr:hypothetical protein [Bacteroidales bacterium]MCR5066000.1 hypothetical protein [Bacteroidales bacterium]
MKKILFISAVLLLAIVASSCSKERKCRCSVRGETYERDFTIDKGKCEDLRYVLYDLHAVISHDLTDSVLCTDYFNSPNEQQSSNNQ